MRPGSILGHPVKRSEDPRFLTGAARYTEDLVRDGALHAVFVRSFAPHARVESIDTAGAAAMPGVAGIYTATDLDLDPRPPESCRGEFARPPLASDRVRFAGEAVAVIVADTRAHALDAAEAVLVDYHPLPALIDPLRATEPDAPLLFPEAGDNIAWQDDFGGNKISFATADVVVKHRFVNQRVAPVPLEGNAILAEPGRGDTALIVHVSCQAPHLVRSNLASALGLKEEELHVIAPAVGGGFGAKIATYPEHIVVAALALKLRRAVRYADSRSENMSAMTHGRAQIQDVELGLQDDGTIVGLRVHLVQDGGAYPDDGGLLPQLTRQMATGVYAIPAVELRARCVATNTTPIAAYRGAGRPEATALIERVVSMAAGELGMDPVQLRRRNFISPDDFPYETVTEATYDCGRYEAALDKALEVAGYESLRREQRARRARADVRKLGIGVACYVEVTGFGPEFGAVEVHEDGGATVRTGVSPHGQGHETSLAQVTSGVLGIPFDKIRVVHSDTQQVPRGGGTMGSRSLQKGGSAVHKAAAEVLEKAKKAAASRLEASPEDIASFEDGRLGIAGVPDSALEWSELVSVAAEPLRATTDFEGEELSYPFGAHVSVVEVDTETGQVFLRNHFSVDDCGRILNPMLVRGQVHGGLAQGIAQALFEQVVYDDDGTLLTGNLAFYGIPSAAELVSFDTHHTETPTPLNPLGAKGIGESATIGSTPAVQNAVIDALSDLGVVHLDMPLTPQRIWSALGSATPPAAEKTAE